MLYTGRVEIRKGVLHVRSAPDGPIVGTLAKGDEVGVLSDEGAWVQIAYAGGEGYAAKQYIVFREAESAARLVISDEAGRAFAPEGTITIRLAAGDID